MPAQLVVSQDARKVHERVFTLERKLLQALERVIRRVPCVGRIDDQEGAALFAIPLRDQEHGQPHIFGARRRRYAQEIEMIALLEGEQAGALDLGADHVVVGERRPIVTVRVGAHVTRARRSRGMHGAIRPLRRQITAQSHELGLSQHVCNMTLVVPRHRYLGEYLLVFDVVAALHAHALHGQVESRHVPRRYVVVVDARAQELPRPGTRRPKRQRAGTGAQCEGGRAGAVHDAHDERLAAAVIEKMLDRVRQAARLPEAAEGMLELGEVPDGDGSIHGTAQRASHECRTRRAQSRNGLVRASFFLYPEAQGAGRHKIWSSLRRAIL